MGVSLGSFDAFDGEPRGPFSEANAADAASYDGLVGLHRNLLAVEESRRNSDL
jgi:hypothetical protein